MPIITALEIQKKLKNRVNIYIDYEFYCGLSLEVVMKEGLKKGQEVEDPFLEVLQRKEWIVKARESALRLLDFRPRSKKELATRLRQKSVPAMIIDEVLNKLEKSGLINDEAFAKMVVHDLKLKRMGKRRLTQELMGKGLTKEIIENVLLEIDEENEYEVCLEAAEKKIRAYRQLDHQIVRRRLTAFLLRRGFSHRDVYQVVARLVDNQEQ